MRTHVRMYRQHAGGRSSPSTLQIDFVFEPRPSHEAEQRHTAIDANAAAGPDPAGRAALQLNHEVSMIRSVWMNAC